MTDTTNAQMPERIWLQAGEKTELGLSLRKWSSKPFEAGTEYTRADLAQPAERGGVVDVAPLVESMCMTWRHDFGLEAHSFGGFTEEQRNGLRMQMRQLLENDVMPFLSTNRIAAAPVVSAENTRINPDMPADQLRLHFGELTADELLLVRSAIRFAQGATK